MADREVAVKVQDLTKSFKIPLEASSGIKQKLINTLKGRKGYRDFTPLNDISFEIEKGDFFGIVGRNGSGKSTLLKSIAGIYAPNKGAVHVNGTLVPFIELGVGFNPELSGRENVFLNGALLGFSHAEMEAMYHDIVEFAELEEFMDERLKNYSSGMQVRLAFSIAIRAQSDILLLDEVLAVGDEAFQRKCYAYFEQLRRQKKTVILVTHDMSAVEKFCNKAMLIEKGKIIKIGDPQVTAHAYRRLFSLDAADQTEEESEEADIDGRGVSDKRWGTGEYVVDRLRARSVKVGDKKVVVDLDILCREKQLEDISYVFAYTVKTKDRRSLFGEKIQIPDINKLSSGEKLKLVFSFNNVLSADDYFFDASLRKDDEDEYSDFWIDASGFSMVGKVENGLNIMVDTKLVEDD